ncbi:DUF1932 domain-containing protein [Streptomyces sp. NPDC094038]|uniref:NAD(P)-dependent oxidoreductase n=1 Tax=Streptomyces sp. NPDC094038 TaxID=3366055 RepID=UPI003821F0A7
MSHAEAEAATVGLLHPGRMGGGFGGALADAGHRVLWCRVDRSAATARRAEEFGLRAVDDLARLTALSDVIVSICPPHHAPQVAAAVAESGFRGLFLDANGTTRAALLELAGKLSAADIRVVDGCVIGPCPQDAPGARLHLAGEGDDVARIISLFDGTGIRALDTGGSLGAASALKTSYATYQKVAYVLAGIAYAYADAQGVIEPLVGEASLITRSPLTEVLEDGMLPSVASRAWRWGPELTRCADALREAGLPGDLADAAIPALERWFPARDAFDGDTRRALDLLGGRP